MRDPTHAATPDRPSLFSRREMLALLGAMTAAAACDRHGVGSGATASSGTPSDSAATNHGQKGERFFSPAERATVTILADMVIPRDDRSGGAVDAGVPDFMDYALRDVESERARVQMRGGLAWLDHESEQRFGKTFVQASEAERAAIVNDIAWPKKAKPELSQGVAFFNDFRDLVATGFFSSKMGVQDLQYIGNTVVRRWDGCPPAALQKLGVSYDGRDIYA